MASFYDISKYLDDESCKRSVANIGNASRISELMKKAESGGEYTVMAFGGSISQGTGASSIENSYGYLVKEWWKNTFPKADFKFVNAGLGSANPEMGCYRYDVDVRAFKPDFVIIDFAVNTYLDDSLKNTYPTLLYRLLEDGAAVMAVYFARNSSRENYKNAIYKPDTSVPDKRIADAVSAYSIPAVSFNSFIWEKSDAGELSWSDVGADWIHPNNSGHAIAAALICKQLEAIKSAPSSDVLTYPKPDDGCYLHARMLTNASSEISCDFIKLSNDSTATHGWNVSGTSGTLTLNVPENTDRIRLFLDCGAAKGSLMLESDSGKTKEIKTADAVTPTLIDIPVSFGARITLKPALTEGTVRIFGIGMN